MQTISFPPLLNLAIGYIVSLVVGGVFMELIMPALRNRSEVLDKQKNSPKRDIYLVRILGALERFLYTTCIIMGQPAGIAAWLAIKVLTRWSDEKDRWSTISRANIYLIGNLITVLFGIVGGLLSLLLPK